MNRFQTAALLIVVTALFVLVSFGNSAEPPGSNVQTADSRAPVAETTIEVRLDTYISESPGVDDENYGSDSSMLVGNTEFGYERYALAEFDLSAIPEGATINSARLDVYLISGGSSPETIEVYRNTENWSEGAATWNTRPNIDCCWGSTSVGTAVDRYYAWDVTSLVQNWAQGTYANHGLALRGDFYPGKSFETQEHVDDHPARLVIEYTSEPDPTPVPASIGDRVWHDANHNGEQDSGESGIQDVHLNLEQDGVVLNTDTTGSNGHYLFGNLDAGTYRISVDDWTLPAGYVLTSGEEPWDVTVSAGEDRENIDFGYALPPTPTPTATPVPDLQPVGMEVTQGIQNERNWVDLVAGKRTFVRLFARSDGGSHWTSAVLQVSQGSAERWLLPLNDGAGINVGRYLSTSSQDGAFLFELPSGFREGPVDLTAHLNPGLDLVPWERFVSETDYANNTYSKSIAFEDVPPLNLGIVRVGYRRDGSDHWPAFSHVTQLVSWLEAAYPIDDLNWISGTAWYGDLFEDRFKPCARLNRRLEFFAPSADDGGPRRTYAMVSDSGKFMRGCAEGGVRADNQASGPTGDPASGRFDWDDDSSYGDWYGGHEIGHTLGRSHAPFCDADGSAYYPWPGGDIGSPTDYLGPYNWRHDFRGFDVRDHEIYPDWWHDVMSYCDYQWISDFTYEGLMERLQDAARQQAGQAAPMDRLLVSGVIDPDTGESILDPLFVIPNAEEQTPRVPGDYAIVLRDDAGVELAHYAFTPEQIRLGPPVEDEAEEGAVAGLAIGEHVPYVTGTDRVEIEGPDGNVLTSITAGAAKPDVAVSAPTGGEVLDGDPVTVAWSADDANGDPLAFLVQYSEDDGATWETVAFPTGESTIEIAAANLAGSTQARFRVLASDGIHTAVAVSDQVTVPNRQPSVEITSPPDGTTVLAGQTLNLSAIAYDADTGSMPDNLLTWNSDSDGLLGNGKQLSTNELSPGTHTLTFHANDGAGGEATSNVEVTVVSDPGQLPLPADGLVASPERITLDLGQGSSTQRLFLKNENTQKSISWQASASEPWVELGATSGATPDSILVSVSDTSVPAGATATVTLTSPDNPNESISIQVRITRSSFVLLPLVTR